MGLDVSAYSHLAPTDEVLPLDKQGRPDYSAVPDQWWDDLYDSGRVVVYAWVGHEHAIEGMEAGRVYGPTDQTGHFGFRAGSYGGYNAFRATLCRQAIGVDPEVLWANPGRFADRPFFELVNFSDCEGVMGTVASANLHQDFLADREAFVAAAKNIEDGDYFVERYDAWTEATGLAAQDGVIVFH